jgi:hypothetical protein
MVSLDAAFAQVTPEEVTAFRTKYPMFPDPIAAHFQCFLDFRRGWITGLSKQERMKQIAEESVIIVQEALQLPLASKEQNDLFDKVMALSKEYAGLRAQLGEK